MAIRDLTPIINGVAYSHADITLNLGAIPIIGLTSIEYGDTQAITANYSTGHEPTSVGFGQNESTGTITITFEAMRLIQITAPGGKIQNLPFFNVGVNYLPEGEVLVRHVLTRCRFKGRSQSSETGNSEIPITLELFVSQINYGLL